jgi:signal transduction histidine kinase
MSASPLRILHVDDNVLDRELVRDALERDSIQFVVTAAVSRQEFETQLFEGAYDVILTDFNILGFEGLQVIDAVHRHNPSLPVILITGTGSEEVAVEAMKRGAADYVIKTPRHIRRLPLAILAAFERNQLQEERLRSERALRASEAHLRAVVSGTPVILFELDPNGVLTFLQGRGVHIFEDNPQLFLGNSIFDSLGEIIPDIRERFRMALAGEETSSIQKWGDIILDVRYSPFRNNLGEVSGIIGVATDITERLNAEKLRIELEKEQEVVALKERFIATASHDFRTPLTIIKMNVHMLEIYLDRMAPQQRTAKLKQIEAQVDHMVQLIDDVLTISKANAGKLGFKPVRIALKPFCEQIWESFRSMAEKTHTVEFVYDVDYNEIELDPNLVHYILANLLSNAIKYSPHNGHVCFRVNYDEHRLVFQVADNGIGIPEPDQQKLFQPFYRASNTFDIEGTGLGLSIVKSYVETHGGTIDVQSKENEGTIITVELPFHL